MISTEAAELPLAVEDVDMDKVKALESCHSLIVTLDEWILSPDRDLVPSLHELAKVVNKTYQFPKELTLYRGFNLNGYQDSVGIKELPHVGQVIHSASDDKPLSFATDIEIAKAFGEIVICAKIDTKKTHFLYITDELAYLVGKLRKHTKFTTQKEVIILPPSNFQATVVQAKKNPFGWLGW